MNKYTSQIARSFAAIIENFRKKLEKNLIPIFEVFQNFDVLLFYVDNYNRIHLTISYIHTLAA